MDLWKTKKVRPTRGATLGPRQAGGVIGPGNRASQDREQGKPGAGTGQFMTRKKTSQDSEPDKPGPGTGVIKMIFKEDQTQTLKS